MNLVMSNLYMLACVKHGFDWVLENATESRLYLPMFKLKHLPNTKPLMTSTAQYEYNYDLKVGMNPWVHLLTF